MILKSAPAFVRVPALAIAILAAALPALADVPDDFISVPLGFLEGEKNAAWEAIDAERWSDALSHLEAPAKAGLRRSQFLYGLAIAFAGSPVEDQDTATEALAWMLLSEEGGRMRWSSQVRKLRNQATDSTVAKAEQRLADLKKDYGLKSLNMRCTLEAEGGSQIRYSSCYHRRVTMQGDVLLPKRLFEIVETQDGSLLVPKR